MIVMAICLQQRTQRDECLINLGTVVAMVNMSTKELVTTFDFRASSIFGDTVFLAID